MDDLFSLKGRNAVIVGGAGGIGSGLAEGFARHGAQVAIADINLNGLEKAAADIEAATGQKIKAPATEFPIDDWDKLFMVNVRGVMLCCKHFAAHMVQQGGGKIINLSSIRGARAALGGNLAYCSSKGAVDMMTRQLAVELASKKVLVNAIAPIITITPMTEERVKREADRYEKMLVNVPMNRMGTVADLVGPAVFLASAASDFVTGSILYPDGGTMAFV